MAVRIVNKMGVISIENEIIEAAAAITVLDCYGIAGLASKRDKKNGSVILYGDDYSQAIGLKISEKTLSIDVHVIAEYGANIQSVGDNAIEEVKKKVGDIVGVKVGEVGIFVEGVAMS